MASLVPDKEQLKALADLSGDGPVVMVNLLKFTPQGGEASYAAYSETAYRLVRELGGKVVYCGACRLTFIGYDQWDRILLVEYPSRMAFLHMLADPAYLGASRFRSEGLVDSRLYVTYPEKNI